MENSVKLEFFVGYHSVRDADMNENIGIEFWCPNLNSEQIAMLCTINNIVLHRSNFQFVGQFLENLEKKIGFEIDETKTSYDINVNDAYFVFRISNYEIERYDPKVEIIDAMLHGYETKLILEIGGECSSPLFGTGVTSGTIEVYNTALTMLRNKFSIDEIFGYINSGGKDEEDYDEEDAAEYEYKILNSDNEEYKQNKYDHKEYVEKENMFEMLVNMFKMLEKAKNMKFTSEERKLMVDKAKQLFEEGVGKENIVDIIYKEVAIKIATERQNIDKDFWYEDDDELSDDQKKKIVDDLISGSLEDPDKEK